MRAQIVKINPKTIVIKSDGGKFATINKDKIDFRYKLGDIIIVEKNGDEVYYLPKLADDTHDTTDFWGDTQSEHPHNVGQKDKNIGYNEKSIHGALLIIGLAIISYLIAFYACLGAAVGVFFYSIAHYQELSAKKKSTATGLLVFGAILWLILIIIAQENGL